MAMLSRCFLLAFVAWSISQVAYGYELGTHARLTYKAYEKSVLFKDGQLLQELGIDAAGNSPFGDTYYDVSQGTVQERKADPFEAGYMIDQLY